MLIIINNQTSFADESAWHGTVRLVVSDLYREDAIGNFVLSLHSLFEKKGIPSAVYAERNGNDITTNGTYTDFLSHVRSEDVLFYQLSNIDRRFHELMDSLCRKIVYYHNITPGHYFAAYLPDVAKRLDLGREQFARLNEVDALLANSRYSLDEVAPFARTGIHMKAVPPVTPDIVERLQPTDRPIFPDFLQQGTPYLIMVGRIVPHKRYEDAITIFSHLAQLLPDMHLVMAGSWCEPYVNSLREPLATTGSLADKIHITGPLPTAALQNALHFASGLLCVSRHEGFGVPVLEAMGLGLPVFAHDLPAFDELLKGAGRIFDSRHPQEAAASIAEVLNDREIGKAIVKAQKKRYVEIMRKADGKMILEALESVLQS